MFDRVGPGFTYSKKRLVKRGEYQSSKLKT